MIGVDVVDVERLRRTLGRKPTLETRLFNETERAYCSAQPDPIVRYAGTLAAKEAAIKALGLGTLASWARRIEVTRDATGRPSAMVEGCGPVAVSITHDGPLAIAVAFAAAEPVSA